MSRELLVLRHAKSAWDTNAPSDFERPLAKRGRRAAPRVGRWLEEQGLIPDHVVSSPAERAKQTVIAVCQALGIDGADDGLDLVSPGSTVRIVDDGTPSPADPLVGPRVGISRAVDTPWRWRATAPSR